MNLLIDLGNARIKWACSRPGAWSTAAALLGNEPLAGLLDRLWDKVATPEKVVVSSVAAGARHAELESWVWQRWSLRAQSVRAERERLGVRNGYRDPSSLGADRWVALIAARRLVSGPVCVVDCGTAVTIDALSAEGDFMGGVIFPGLRLLRTSLVQATQGIRETSGAEKSCLARSTADAVAAGTAFGLAGAIERVLAEQCERLGNRVTVLTTGADAPMVFARIRRPVREVPDLVLRGLAFIANEDA